MAPAEPAAPTIRVDVVYCPRPGEIDQRRLQLRAGSTLAAAIEASGVLERHGLLLDAVRVGIWCKAQPLETQLRDLDRVELYRPLTVDPKEARRQRYKGHREGQRAKAAPRIS